MLAPMFKDMRVAISLEPQGTLVRTNATQVQGQRITLGESGQNQRDACIRLYVAGVQCQAGSEEEGCSIRLDGDVCGGVVGITALRIERGEASPTAALLGRLSGAFGLTVSTLLARSELRGGRLLRAGEQPLWRDPATG